jgi:hypothetical protein
MTQRPAGIEAQALEQPLQPRDDPREHHAGLAIRPGRQRTELERVTVPGRSLTGGPASARRARFAPRFRHGRGTRSTARLHTRRRGLGPQRPRESCLRVQGDDSRWYGRWHVGRQAACTFSACEPRSTAKGAYFVTWRGATVTSVACEVTLYLAVPSPSSSRLALPGLVASSSSVLGWAHCGAATATLGGPALGPRTRRSSASPRTTYLASGCWPRAQPRNRRHASRQPRRSPR